MIGSLATNTGPSQGQWSTANRQYVHVGEEVSFSFTLTDDPFQRRPVHPFGHADYCTATLGSDRVEATLDEGGHYRFQYVMSGRRVGEVVPVQAVAYRRRGHRDFMKIGDVWLRGTDPFDPPDDAVARDTIELNVYRSRVELFIEESPNQLDPANGRLELVKSDASVTTVYGDPGDGHGFRHFGPDKNGMYRIVYDPLATEVNRSGQTEVRFIAEDLAGRRHVAETTIETP